ncbi:hypothetical protein Q765_10440 [Flavobacterium rivuli WB 3.3-2 = DSM 21788]|uniref:DUF305 domain-containing protein n=1 Tax=Flavobacterium rivuli WB 3.3-2 = DSM 21788 TaxID=1121895 RepID=A0A0A2M4V5_9FLAO|nr:DUF305 domain-containing protein [Flavobacterium rivuli]KGO86631.1 hypothetical protein Q765_10440 [Flavobacterium rivuli WB 3.3-2 = DSM 21788]
MEKNSYKKLGLMLAVSFLIMYGVMFLNVDSADHIYLSLTRTYMSLLMVCPMAILMLVFMPMMYKNKKWNTGIIISAVVVFGCSLVFMRDQVLVSDVQYMKAMIPHHSSAILTSKHANLKDPEVKKLSEQIIKSQEEEIQQMKAAINRLQSQP